MKEEKPATARKKTGRPLSFDRDAALDAAMLVFWRLGYEAASISELTAAMNITPPSLYTAFGDKQRLFQETMSHYLESPDRDVPRILRDAPTAYDAMRELLESATVEQTRKGLPHGCLLMSSAVSSPVPTEVQSAAIALRASWEHALKARIERGIKEKELPADTDGHALAAFFMTVLQGLSTQARDGASRNKLRAIADTALRAWPVPPLQ